MFVLYDQSIPYELNYFMHLKCVIYTAQTYLWDIFNLISNEISGPFLVSWQTTLHRNALGNPFAYLNIGLNFYSIH